MRESQHDQIGSGFFVKSARDFPLVNLYRYLDRDRDDRAKQVAAAGTHLAVPDYDVAIGHRLSIQPREVPRQREKL